jgi:alpha-tubulin suppressor-like RCC1 family protein
MNLINFIKPLEQAMQSSCTGLDHLTLSKTLEQLNVGVIFGDTNDVLPDPAINEGKLYYIENDKTIYWSNGVRWQAIYWTTSDNVSLYSWGNNGNGQLGDNTTVDKSSPVSVVGGFTDWCQVSAGSNHSLAVRTNGTLWAWGCNSNGLLGDDTTTSTSSPVSVVGGFTDWCQVSAGSNHSLAVRTNGTMWAWGFPGDGRLGDGTITGAISPVSVVGGFTDWCQASAGGFHSGGIRCDGSLWMWGYNGKGQLGVVDTTDRCSPVSVAGGFTDWRQVGAGHKHTVALKQNGTLWAWGYNNCGQLGDASTNNTSSPVSVVGGFTDWCQISAGKYHNAGLRTNGTIWAWGGNNCGQIGDSTLVNKSSPVSVVGGFTNWCLVAAYEHTSAIKTDGSLWTWGPSCFGQIGDGFTVNRSSPVSIVGGLTKWCSLDVGGNGHVLAIRKN